MQQSDSKTTSRNTKKITRLIPLIPTYLKDQKFTHPIPTQPKNNPKPKNQTAKHPKMRRGK